MNKVRQNPISRANSPIIRNINECLAQYNIILPPYGFDNYCGQEECQSGRDMTPQMFRQLLQNLQSNKF